MPTYSVAEARNNLSKLIEKAEKGETVEITRHGKAAVWIVGPLSRPRESDWRAALNAIFENRVRPEGGKSDATAMVRAMRDEGA
jgi:prevent-host-death family protein